MLTHNFFNEYLCNRLGCERGASAPGRPSMKSMVQSSNNRLKEVSGGYQICFITLAYVALNYIPFNIGLHLFPV